MAVINLNHFYYFYEVARCGSFTRAARELLVSQSAISVQIKSLEEEMGGPLFDRRKGGVDLTESGALAYGTAERVFQEIAPTCQPDALEAELLQLFLDDLQTTAKFGQRPAIECDAHAGKILRLVAAEHHKVGVAMVA